MTDRTRSSYAYENGWKAGNTNMGYSFPPPPYHTVTSETPNFTNATGPQSQIPFPLNSLNHSPNPLKKNQEPAKFNPNFCQPYNINDINNFEMCPRMQSSSKQQQNTHTLYGNLPAVSHCSNIQQAQSSHNSNHVDANSPMAMSENYAKKIGPPVISRVTNANENVTSYPSSQNVLFSSYNSSNNPQIEQLNAKIFQMQPLITERMPFHTSQNFHGPQPYPGPVGECSQPPPYVQSNSRQIFDAPPPVVGPPPTVNNTNIRDSGLQCGNFQQFRLPPPQLMQSASSNKIFSSEPQPPYVNFHNVLVASPAYPRPPYPPVQELPPPYGETLDNNVMDPSSRKETLLIDFLQKLQVSKKQTTKSVLTVVQFRSALKEALFLTKMLLACKQNLTSLLHGDEQEWNTELQRVNQLKDQLSSVCSVLSIPDYVNAVQKKLRTIKKKRLLKFRLKREAFYSRLKQEQEREALHLEIDKWLDGIKEKNLKLKRQAEMKKEADIILSEVRKKIHEAKKTIEKLKVLEKLRAARQANAQQKGLFLVPEHSLKFEEKMYLLRRTMSEQLVDYEAEERALKVMLETEQEGQLEEESLWRIKKMKLLQQKKQSAILESFFGDIEEPTPDDPLFLFYQHQNAGNCSIDSLVQIRHHWDVHLAEYGESVPQQWIVPFPPNSPAWEAVYKS